MSFFVSLDHTLTLTSLFRSNMLPLSAHFQRIVESKISRPFCPFSFFIYQKFAHWLKKPGCATGHCNSQKISMSFVEIKYWIIFQFLV